MSIKYILSSILFICLTLHLSAQYTQQFILTCSKELTVSAEHELNLNGLEIDRKIFNNPILYRLKYINVIRHSKSINAKAILSIPGIIAFKEDKEATFRTTEPNDPLFSEMYHHRLIGSPRAWDFATSGTTSSGDEVVLAIFDSGYELDHPDLADNFWTNPDEIPGDGIDNDNNGYIDDVVGVNFTTGADDHARRLHGTEVIGTIGASGNNGEGISGMTWNAKLLPMSKSVGGIFESDFIESYNYIIELRKKYNETDGREGAFIVAMNLSLGLGRERAADYPEWCAVYEEMGRHGILGISATDNDDYDVDVEGDMPATCTSLYQIAVTGSNEADELMNNVATGRVHIDLAAPGDDLFTTTLDADYATRSGTSLASPLVTGAIGLMYMAASDELIDLVNSDPRAAARTMREILLENVFQTEELSTLVSSGGRLDVGAAVIAAANFGNSELPGGLAIQVISPNPVSDDELVLNIDVVESDPVEISIFDMHMGRIVTSYTESSNLRIGTNEYPIPVRNLASGTYVIVVEQNGERVMDRFVKLND